MSTLPSAGFPLQPKRRVALEAVELELSEELRASLEPSFEVVEGVDSLPSGIGVLVLAARRLDAKETRDRIRRCRATVSPAPTLLVTSGTPDNLVHLSRLLVDEV